MEQKLFLTLPILAVPPYCTQHFELRPNYNLFI